MTDPYCTATVHGRRCYAFKANGLAVCASHNPDRWGRTHNPAGYRRRLAKLRAKRDATATTLAQLDAQLAELEAEAP